MSACVGRRGTVYVHRQAYYQKELWHSVFCSLYGRHHTKTLSTAEAKLKKNDAATADTANHRSKTNALRNRRASNVFAFPRSH
jgi:hypothetical protein